MLVDQGVLPLRILNSLHVRVSITALVSRSKLWVAEMKNVQPLLLFFLYNWDISLLFAANSLSERGNLKKERIRRGGGGCLYNSILSTQNKMAALRSCRWLNFARSRNLWISLFIRRSKLVITFFIITSLFVFVERWGWYHCMLNWNMGILI